MNLGLMTLVGLGLGGAYWGFKHKDPDMKMSHCFFDKLATPLYTFFNQYRSNTGLLVNYIDDESVIVNTPLEKLYGIELTTGYTIHRYLSKNSIDMVISAYKLQDNASFYYVMQKQDKWQKQYLFSYNAALIKVFAKEFDVPLLSGKELTNIIYDLYLQNSYRIENKQIYRNIVIDKEHREQEPEYMSFKRLARQAIYKSFDEIDIFQGFKKQDKLNTNILELFKSNFNGAIWFMFDFGERRVQGKITSLINEAKMAGNKEPFLELKKLHDNGDTNLMIVNTTAFFKEYSDEVVSSFGTNLKTSYLPKELFRTDVIRKTPLKTRDLDFDFLVKSDFLTEFVASIHKKRAKKPDIFGVDRNGGFINFSFSEENDNPHSVIIAKPGSGKSVSKQKIMSQMVGLDFETGECHNLGSEPGNVKIRSYDIGFSDENFISLIKNNPKNNVAHIKSSLSAFRYNLIGVDFEVGSNPYSLGEEAREIFSADIMFAVDLASLVLSSSGSEALNSNEAGFFKKIIENLYVKNNFQKYRLKELEKDHQELLTKLEALGYNTNNYISDIKEPEYAFLKRPLIGDAIKVALINAQNQQIQEEDRKEYASLASKLEAINKLDIFSTFDKVDVKEADIISMDLNNFKESSLFTPIFYCIFQKVYLKDREFALSCKRAKRPAPKLFYAIEEAKNFFRNNPTFESMFDKVTLEARKYNVHLCFIVQNAEHLPKFILKNINTRIFLLNQNVKLEVIQEADSAFTIPNDVKEALANTNQYELCVWYKGGVFNMRFEISPVEMKVFSTNPNEL